MNHRSSREVVCLPQVAATHFVVRFLMVLAVAVAAIVPASKAHAAPAPSSDNPAALLRAIAEVETGNNPRKVGRHGERGLYQIRQMVWRRYTNRAFCDAHIPSASREVATQHVTHIESELRRAGIEPTPFRIASAWNAGLSAVLNNRVPASTRDYAQRVSNLTVAFAAEVAPRRVLDNASVMVAAQ